MKKETMISQRLNERVPALKDMIDTQLMKVNGIYYLDIAVDDEKKISYISKDRLDRFNGDFWNTELRQKFAMMGRIGRVLKKCNYDISYDEIMEVTNSLVDKSKYQIKIVTGTDIAKYYNEENCYNSGQGDLMSCMSHVPASYFNLYQKICSMVVVLDEHDLCVGRSLIFHNVNCGYKDLNDNRFKTHLFRNGDVASRIYYAYSYIYDMIADYLEKEDIPRFNGGYDATEVLLGNHAWHMSEVRFFIEINQSTYENNRYPYIDNFSNCYRSEEGYGNKYLLSSSCGGVDMDDIGYRTWSYEEDISDTEGFPRGKADGGLCDGCLCSDICSEISCGGYDMERDYDDEEDY